MFLEIKNLTKKFDEKTVVDHLDLNIEKGELVCILGASGCGKTTTLNLVGGFIEPDYGIIFLDGEEITNFPPEIRPVSTVFQAYSLFPHMSVIQNVIYGLKFKKLSKAESIEKGKKFLELVGLSDHIDKRIHELSGGQQQRVALARALIVEPKVCLLDEPFSNLDASLRIKLRSELKRIQKELGTTMVFVTHDQEEALVIADRIAIMDKGKLITFDTPDNILKSPGSGFVSEFLRMDELRWGESGELLRLVKKEGGK